MIIFKHKQILNYAFEKLKCKDIDTLKLSALALSRLAARLDDQNSEFFIQNLREFKDFDIVVENINKSADQCEAILMYFLNFLENISSYKKSRDELDCPKCKNMI